MRRFISKDDARRLYGLRDGRKIRDWERLHPASRLNWRAAVRQGEAVWESRARREYHRDIARREGLHGDWEDGYTYERE